MKEQDTNIKNTGKIKNKGVKRIIFCAAYGNIPSALYWTTNNSQNYPVILVIIGNHNLFRFFEVINEKVLNNSINLIYLEPHRLRRAKAGSINAIIHLLPDIIKEKQCLKNIFNQYFAKLEGCEVFFFSRGFDGALFYLLKKLSRKNTLIYMAYYLFPQYNTMCEYAPTNLVDFVRLIIYKLLYGWDITTGKYPCCQSPYLTGFSFISDKFIEKEVDRVFNEEEKSKMMKKFDLSRFKIFDASNYSVIYFDDGLINSSLKGCNINKETFKKELTQIFQILIKYFPENKIAYKYHPGYSGDKTLITIGDNLPDFIPAEFLYNDNTKIYLGIFSFSIASVEKGLAVSLADLISFSGKLRNQLKESLIKTGKSKILFPKSLGEFEQILINLEK